MFHGKAVGDDVPIDPGYWQQQIQAMACRGQRVLAIAFKSVGDDYRELKFADLETGLTLMGIAGMIDPPWEDAIRAVHRCQSAGIQVKMITGDHAVTAVAVGILIVFQPCFTCLGQCRPCSVLRVSML